MFYFRAVNYFFENLCFISLLFGGENCVPFDICEFSPRFDLIMVLGERERLDVN